MTQHPGSIEDVLQPKHHDSSKASTAGHQVTTSGQVFWLPDQSTHRAFPSRILSGICGFCPRLQRRDRDGFTPSSLFSRTDNKSHEHPCRFGIVPIPEKNSTVHCIRPRHARKNENSRRRNQVFPHGRQRTNRSSLGFDRVAGAHPLRGSPRSKSFRFEGFYKASSPRHPNSGTASEPNLLFDAFVSAVL